MDKRIIIHPREEKGAWISWGGIGQGLSEFWYGTVQYSINGTTILRYISGCSLMMSSAQSVVIAVAVAVTDAECPVPRIYYYRYSHY